MSPKLVTVAFSLGMTAAFAVAQTPSFPTPAKMKVESNGKSSLIGRPPTGSTDDTALNYVWCNSEADVSYSVKSKNIHFSELGSFYGDPSDTFLTGLVVDAAQIPFSSAAAIARAFATTYVQFFLSDINIKNRGYLTYIPTQGHYRIITHYKGIWGINSSNYININKADGTPVFSHSCQLGSDKDWIYELNLSAGLYTITVGVGEVSNMFVSAGSLNSILLSNESYLNWTERKVVGDTNIGITSVLPVVGNMAWVATSGADFTDPSIIEGRVTGLSNYHHEISIDGFRDTISMNEYLIQNGWPVNCYHRQSIQANAEVTLGPVITSDGSTARWFLKRSPDFNSYITIMGNEYPSPLWWNGDYIMVASDCNY